MKSHDEWMHQRAPTTASVAVISIKQILRNGTVAMEISSLQNMHSVGITREKPFVSILALVPLCLHFHLRKYTYDDGTIPAAAPAQSVYASTVYTHFHFIHPSPSSVRPFAFGSGIGVICGQSEKG